MIDSLYLFTGNYQPYFEGDFERKIIEDEDGEVKSEVYFKNTDLFNLEFGKSRTRNGALESLPLNIHFSIPKLLNRGKYNLDFNHSDIGEVRGFLDDTLRPFKVKSDSLKVGRVDIYKNIRIEPLSFIYTIEGFPHYNRYKKQTYFSDGVYNLTYINKSKELGLYDKTTELKHKYNIDLGFSVVRSELRFKKHKVCKDFGIDRFRDAEEMIKEEKALKVIYNSQVEKVIRKAKAKKGGNIIMGSEDLGTKDMDILLIGMALDMMGEKEALNQMRASLMGKVERGIISRRTYYRQLNHYRETIRRYREFKRKVKKKDKKTMDEVYRLLLYENVA